MHNTRMRPCPVWGLTQWERSHRSPLPNSPHPHDPPMEMLRVTALPPPPYSPGTAWDLSPNHPQHRDEAVPTPRQFGLGFHATLIEPQTTPPQLLPPPPMVTLQVTATPYSPETAAETQQRTPNPSHLPKAAAAVIAPNAAHPKWGIKPPPKALPDSKTKEGKKNPTPPPFPTHSPPKHRSPRCQWG